MTTYRIQEMVKPYIEYDMIQNHTDLPHFPEFRTHLLHAVLKQSSLAEFSDLFSLATALVQLGLDTHDTVCPTNAVKEKKIARERQMKVLAGAYFSSRFYYLLSHAGKIDVISTLSSAICEANRIKLNAYLLMNQLKMTADTYITEMVEAHAQLFLSFTAMLNDSLKSVWPDLLRRFTRCEVLLQEVRRSQTAEDARYSWGFWHIWQLGTKEERALLTAEEPDKAKLRSIWHKYRITAQLDHLLEEAVNKLREQLKRLESDKLADELARLCEPFCLHVSKLRAAED